MIGEIAEGLDPPRRSAPLVLRRHAGSYGVPASAFGQVFTWLGQHYRLSACSARRCKFPFTAERVSDGRRIRLPSKVIRAAFLAKSSPEQSEVLGTELSSPSSPQLRTESILAAVIVGAGRRR